MRGFIHKKLLIFLSTGALVATILGVAIFTDVANQQKWARTCDGKTVIESCSGEDGIKYKKYLYHAAEAAVTEEVYHPATPARTHTVTHPAVTGTRQVPTGCIRTNIKYKNGTCALSRCRDGMYSGSTGWGACNYHGGVAVSGGPWYTYRTETYIITPAWIETIVDEPAKDAWTETVVKTPAKAEWIEKVKVS